MAIEKEENTMNINRKIIHSSRHGLEVRGYYIRYTVCSQRLI